MPHNTIIIHHFQPTAKRKRHHPRNCQVSFFTRNVNTAELHVEFPFKEYSTMSPLRKNKKKINTEECMV